MVATVKKTRGTTARTRDTDAKTKDAGFVKPSASTAKTASRGKAAGPEARPATPPGPSSKVRQAAILLKQVSDPTRLQILLILADTESSVGMLCEELGGQSQPAVSHHLALLRHGRLIIPRREGKNNLYSLTDEGRKLAENVGTLTHRER